MIYLVEDDSGIRELVVYTLVNSGFETDGFKCASEFWNAMMKKVPELILLDIMLPDEDGLQILKRIRSAPVFRNIPVIMLTAKSTEYDKVIGLDSGADDYIPKPFGMMELISRVKAMLRRTGKTETEKEYSLGKLYVNTGKRTVTANGEPVVLTFKEFELLCYLLKNNEIVIDRDRLLSEIWGYDFNGETRTVDVHIRTLRQKLGDCGKMIETVRGAGYSIKSHDE